ncbi:MAG: hypothetical protein RLY78_2067 [Pseudomonadota bacterium]|jgi:nitrate reductase NapD
MSILGVVAKTLPAHLPTLRTRLAACAGLEITADPGDGRLVLVLEDSAAGSAAALLGEIARWPELLSTTLVYEYSGADHPAPGGHARADWRTDLDRLDRPAAPAEPSAHAIHGLHDTPSTES